MAPALTPQPIVCLQPSATIIVAAIGELERPRLRCFRAWMRCFSLFTVKFSKGSNAVSTKGIRQITGVPGSQLKNSLV
jgi:hypothetical protein